MPASHSGPPPPPPPDLIGINPPPSAIWLAFGRGIRRPQSRRRRHYTWPNGLPGPGPGLARRGTTRRRCRVVLRSAAVLASRPRHGPTPAPVCRAVPLGTTARRARSGARRGGRWPRRRRPGATTADARRRPGVATGTTGPERRPEGRQMAAVAAAGGGHGAAAQPSRGASGGHGEGWRRKG